MITLLAFSIISGDCTEDIKFHEKTIIVQARIEEKLLFKYEMDNIFSHGFDTNKILIDQKDSLASKENQSNFNIEYTIINDGHKFTGIVSDMFLDNNEELKQVFKKIDLDNNISLFSMRNYIFAAERFLEDKNYIMAYKCGKYAYKRGRISYLYFLSKDDSSMKDILADVKFDKKEYKEAAKLMINIAKSWLRTFENYYYNTK